MNKIRLAVGIPAYGGRIVAEHSKMWLELGNTLGASSERFELVLHAYADINGVDRARNWLVAQSMAANADWLFMIDADTWVESESPDADAGFLILRMISDAQRADLSIVGPSVIRRVAAAEKREPTVYDVKGTKHVPYQLDRIPNWGQVDALGTACMAMNLHKVNEANAYFKFTDTLSEDLEFCRQIREAKGKIYCDGRVRTGHLSRPFPLYSI